MARASARAAPPAARTSLAPRPGDAGMARFDSYSPGLKAVAIGLLALVLLVPIALVADLIRERSGRAREAEATIAQQWGRAQTFAPAYLVAQVPSRQWQNGGWLVAPAAHALLPDHVEVDGVLH